MKLAGFPPLDHWLGFLLAVIIAVALVNTIASRLPALARLEQGI